MPYTQPYFCCNKIVIIAGDYILINIIIDPGQTSKLISRFLADFSESK